VSIYSSSVTTPDGMGGGARTKTLVGQVWAEAKPASGTEHQVGEALRGVVQFVFTIRYPTGFTVTPDMHLEWTPSGGSTRTFVIKAIRQQLLMTTWLDLLCAEHE
jgi:head-tail adaptor